MPNLGILALAAGLAVAAGVALYAYAVERVRTIAEGPDGERTHELRVLLKRMSSISLACGGGAAGLAIAWTLQQNADLADGVLTGLVALLCVAFPVVVGRRPAIAAYARECGVQPSAFRSYRSLGALALRLVVLLGPLLAALAINAPGWAGAVVIVAGYLVAGPLLSGLLTPAVARLVAIDPLDEQRQARLAGLAAQAGVLVHGRVIRARTRKVANAMSLGWLPGLRYVVITDYLLDGLTEPEIDAVLAHELGHARHRDALVRQLLTFTFLIPPGLFLAGLAANAPSGYLAAVFGLFALIMLVFRRLTGALAIRQELAADDLAARLADPATARAALTRLTELNAIKADTSKRWDRTVGHPGMAIRTARLAAVLGEASTLGEATATASDA